MRRLILPGLATWLALTACGSTAATSARATPSATPHTSSAPTPTGSFVPDPGVREAASPDPSYDYGFVIQVTPAGIHPQTLLTACCRAVTWKNLTSQTISIVFDHQKVDSGPIAAGSTWVWTPPHIESITYHTGKGTSFAGVLLVQQTFES